MSKAPTARFSDRVDNYVRYRPGYPVEILEVLRQECGLQPTHTIADIASGTGAFTRLLLETGNQVLAIEPNTEMREAGIRLLEAFKNLRSVAGTAESTTLPSASVDFITVAQAAHWFDRQRARAEFKRILRPSGWCLFIWNQRRIAENAFLRDYEQLLHTYCKEYKEIPQRNTIEAISEFFTPAPHQERIFEYHQRFDFEGLAGRLLSTSYSPLIDDPKHAPMMQELHRIFHVHAQQGMVQIDYDTLIFFGRLGT